MAQQKQIIKNVRVFHGKTLSDPRTVVIDGSMIPEAPTDADLDLDHENEASVIDGTGHTLLPGLIDCHVHIGQPSELDDLARHGVTTALDMGAVPQGTFQKVVSAGKATTYRSSGMAAFAPDSNVCKFMVMTGGGGSGDAIQPDDPTGVQNYVSARLAEGVHHVKIIADVPGLSQAQLDELAVLARQNDKLSVAHATNIEAWERSVAAGFDFLTHVPMDGPLGGQLVQKCVDRGTVIVPTLSMMARNEEMTKKYHISEEPIPPTEYGTARDNVTALKRAGVTVLAGSDSNAVPMLMHPHGESFWKELEMLVAAGLSPAEAIWGATAGAAKFFDLKDRGVVEPGKRADLVLIDGNPLQDIRDIRRVKRVWHAGVEFDLSQE